MGTPLQSIQLILSGVVQGVGFRYHTREKATSLHLVGWVRNLPDGTVELLAQGPSDSIDALQEWCQEGPPAAEVSEVKKIERKPLTQVSFTSFEIAG